MHKIIPGILLLGLLAACGGSQQGSGLSAGSAQFLAMGDSARFTTVEWIDSVKDYGKITEGQKLDVAFRFRNTGKTPLVIGGVQPSCGCTIAHQQVAPILPGSEGQIKATFNSDSRVGINHKTLIVTANTKGTQRYVLQFVVEVQKKPS
ncbi:MAG TPA: DUF1573 domain-containing protein [Puia sp.]|nr:DUF1573 domain-containing protein [Puia sp.]